MIYFGNECFYIAIYNIVVEIFSSENLLPLKLHKELANVNSENLYKS